MINKIYLWFNNPFKVYSFTSEIIECHQNFQTIFFWKYLKDFIRELKIGKFSLENSGVSAVFRD